MNDHDPPRMIHVELRVERCAAELYLNDIPLCVRSAPDRTFLSIPAHQYLLDGVNILEVVANPGPSPTRAREVARPGSSDSAAVAVATLVRYPVGVFTGDPRGEVLGVARWQSSGAGATGADGARVTVDLGSMFGDWKWQRARKLALDTPTLAEALDLVSKVRSSFQVGEPSFILETVQPRLEDGARAYPARSLQEMYVRLASYIQANVQRPGWGVEPLRRERIDFRLCGGGRLLECVDVDWSPCVRSVPLATGAVIPFPMMLAYIEGRFRCVR